MVDFLISDLVEELYKILETSFMSFFVRRLPDREGPEKRAVGNYSVCMLQACDKKH